MIGPRRLSTVSFTENDTVRLISTSYIEEPALAPLADDPEDLAILEEIEGRTSPRQASGFPLPADLRPEELLTAWDGPGWAYVNAAFCYTRPTGNRFNGPKRGAWYAAWGQDAVETALAEVSWHLTQELEATGVFENATSYCELIAGFSTVFHDVQAANLPNLLSPDRDVGYPVGQALADAILKAGGNGVIYPSVRRSGGLCLAAFRPRLVQNVREGSTWLLNWTGQPDPALRKLA